MTFDPQPSATQSVSMDTPQPPAPGYVSSRRPGPFREPVAAEVSDSSSDTVGMVRNLRPPAAQNVSPEEASLEPTTSGSVNVTDFSSSIHVTEAELAMLMSLRKGKRVVRAAFEADNPELTSDVKPVLVSPVRYSRVGITPRPVAALMADVDRMVIDTDVTPPQPTPTVSTNVHLEMRPLKISESLERSKLAKFDGTKVHDVLIYYAKFATEMRIRCAHPDIWHRVAFLWLSGTAMSALQSALSANEEPQTFPSFVSFMKSRFPSTVSASTVDEEGDALRQGQGESVSTFWSRFQAWMIKADTVKLSYQPDLMFVKKLKNNELHSHLRSEIARYSLAGQALTLDEIAHLAMEWDNRPNRPRDTVSVVADSSTSRPDNCSRSRKRQASSAHQRPSSSTRPRQHNDGCYNCGQSGHIFGGMDNPSCPQPVSDATKAYFANRRGRGARGAQVSGNQNVSLSGLSKA